MSHDFRHVEMPSQYCQADAQWIGEQLLRLSPSLRRKIAQRYSEVYEVEFEAEPVSFDRRTGQGIRPIHGFANL